VAALACGNCSQPLAALSLAGHYGQKVEIDLCAPCHLVWFDPVESARLAGPGLLTLIGEMAQAQTLAHNTARADLHCPHCRGPLRQVHNRTRWGRSLQLECAAGHGTWQTFGEFLNEKGLLRPMSSADRARVLQRDGALHCVNCGGAVGAREQACSWCGSVPALVDVARLARALDPEAATAGHAVHGIAARSGALQCAACGAAQPADGGWQCASCNATLTAPGLAEAHRIVSALGPALQAHAERPAPHVVKQRLDAQQPALDRQRAAAAEMQAEAEARMGRRAPWPESERTSPLSARPEPVQRWVMGALLALLLWWLFG
jgi:Zn-finger nucleic acid-binding protein